MTTIKSFKGIAPAIAINVYRWSWDDCTNNGISSAERNDTLYIVGMVDDETKEFTPLSEDLYLPDKIDFSDEKELEADNLCLLIKRTLFDENADYLVGLKDFMQGKWCMAGGNFGYSCDSRYSEIINRLPLPIFDRIEN